MTEHTPGPWAIRDAPDEIRNAAVEYWIDGDVGGVPIADIKTNGATQANARLIAAAPELLELARGFKSYLIDDSRSERRRQACLTAARAAIAKATED